MPTLGQFGQSLYEVKIDYDFDEPVIVTVRPFANLDSYRAELDGLEENEEGRLKLYEIACARLASWRNMRVDVPASTGSLDDIPAFARHFYKQVEGADAPLFALDGKIDSLPRAIDVPLEPQALADANVEFALLFDIIKRAMSEVDTKKRSGRRN